MTDDLLHMRAALALARRGLGNAWPNPAVGCVLVKDGRVIGRGWTQPGGRPHAETEALRRAGEAARGATAYVTLEPCSHHGRTPPCCEALAGAGIARVVMAMRDPDPRVNGRGLAMLRGAGIAVEEGLLEAEARALNAGFFRRIQAGMPVVTLKLASTLDGRIATASGESRWITGEAARREVHALRARHDAILVGSGTVLADDPDLTCRIPGMERVPMLRVVADARLRTPEASRLVQGAELAPVLIITAPGHPPAAQAPFMAAGADIVTVPAHAAGGLDLPSLLRALGRRGVTRVLAEGGAGLAAALLRQGLVDRLVWFHAPAVMGGDGHPALQGLRLAALSAMPRFHRTAQRAIGDDMLSEFERIED
ncbi:MAG: bifunctional diaminohydroxyphosphoribosylaminopyrimidine deaminase/5-amino-6-(5-phosphoribosylamino)uracil reductase RibD [Roseomonas sp.]|nr:bifunctional diaminohydroxyphosphoribosylaminopyrimidine deaminase/5-amino-6-(5-phosphoribosylamino)uracil reductase RibD [Roseomonas sp.]